MNWRRTKIYLGWARGHALADYLTTRYGLEVPYSFAIPDCEELPDTMPRYPRTHEKYYTEGGSHWPRRQVIQ